MSYKKLTVLPESKKVNIEYSESAVCQKCNINKPVKGTICPYSEEINNTIIECDCCTECRRECVMDI